MFVSGLIIALYFWTFFSDSHGAGLLINHVAVIISGLTFFVGTVAYLWTPEKYLFASALGMYALLAATTATIIITSQGLESPFIALWILVGIFAGVFGAWGIVPMFVVSGWYLFESVIHGTISQAVIVMTFLAGWLPLLASFIIWHGRREGSGGTNRTYRNLASELNEVANKAEVVINAISDGVVAVDNQGIIQLINPAAQQITGWGKQDATNLSYKSVLKLTDNKEGELTTANDPVQNVLATNKEVATNDLMLVTNSGKKLMVSVVVSPVGQLGAGAIIVFRDITKQKKEEREQAEFISTASHEMRTPVASIEGYLGLALNPNTAQIDEKARDFINKAHESAQHLGRLFQDLLDVSKADDNRLNNNPKVIDIVEFTHDILQGLQPHAEEKGLRFLYKPMPEEESQADRRLTPVFYAHVDADHLREVISNLVENAIKYTPKGDVIIDVSGDSERVRISVADSGIGIPTEDIPHLFQKFYRVDNTDTREIGGTGLGLYLCRKLVEVMSGRIWVESEYKKGSTFFVELPRLDHEEAMHLIELAAQDETKNYPSIVPDNSGTPLTQAAASTPEPAQSVSTPEPAPAPPEPVVIPPQPAAVPSPPPVPEPAVSPTAVNTPLSAIEQNPSQYIAQTRAQALTVPGRDATDTPQQKQP
jgi:PAS domain S-box-containing protein